MNTEKLVGILADRIAALEERIAALEDSSVIVKALDSHPVFGGWADRWKKYRDPGNLSEKS